MKTNMTAFDEIQLKCDFMDGYIISEKGEPKLLGFVLDKPPVFGSFGKPKSLHHEELEKRALNDLKDLIEVDHRSRIDFFVVKL